MSGDTASRDALTTRSSRVREAAPFATVTALFLVWGFVTAVIDGLAPTVRAIFHLTYMQQMLTQSAFFLAYGIVSLPSSLLLAWLGPPRAILLALGVMVAACLIVLIGTASESYAVILVALFVLASGITLLQVAGNPLSASLGDPGRSHFRLTLSQAFNSLGTVLGPLVASHLLLSGGLFSHDAAEKAAPGARLVSLHAINHQFGMIALVVLLLAGLIWWMRRRLNPPATMWTTRMTAPLNIGDPEHVPAKRPAVAPHGSGWALFGALAIFLYVGSEVGTGTIMINFLQQPAILGVTAGRAAELLGIFFWGGLMVGRFLNSQLLRFARAGHVLTTFAIVNVALCLVVTQANGWPAAAAALALGFFDSLMFPTIFTLTLDRSAAPVAGVSGLLCTAIVGGAFVPPLVGLVADRHGIGTAFVVPLVGYVGVAVFALLGRKGS